MCPVDVIRASEDAPGITTLQQARENATRVIEDHRFFADAQARLAEQVRPRNLVDLLQGDYNLRPVLPPPPEPLPEEQVQMATQAAGQALEEERGRMGGDPGPSSEILAEGGEDAEPEETAPDAPPAPAQRRPSEDLADFFDQMAHLRGEVAQVRASINGLGMRMVEMSNRLADAPATRKPIEQPPVPAPAGPSAPGPRAAGAPPQALPSLAQRRSARGGEGAPFEEPTGLEGGSRPQHRPVEEGPDAPPRNGRPRMLQRLGWAAAALLVVGVAVQAIGPFAALRVQSEAELVEKQTLGLGAYLRSEQAELERSSRRVVSLPTEITQLRGQLLAAQDAAERRDLARQVEDKEAALQRGLRAAQGLDALEQVSGVRRASSLPQGVSGAQ